MKWLIGLFALAFASAAWADGSNIMRPNMRGAYGGLPVSSSCPYGNSFADGCQPLSAAGHIGLYTFNGQNGLGAGNAFFTNTTVGARQSGQAAYSNTPYSSSHPLGWNQAGGDYGIGPWLADASLALAYDSTNGAWSSSNYVNPALAAQGCTYSAANRYLRCDFTGTGASYNPTAITGSINASGVLTIASGTVPTVGTYVYYATAEAEPVVNKVIAPYLVSSSIDSSHVQLAGSPPVISTQNLSWAPVWTLSGYLFKDIGVYMGTGSGGVINVVNNKFIAGTNECTLTLTNFFTSNIPNTTGWITNNYAGMQPSSLGGAYCSAAASMYPLVGTAQATFTGSTATVNPVFAATITSGAMTISSVTSGYISIGMQVTGTGLPSGVTYVKGFVSGTKNTAGAVYSVQTCTGGVTSSQVCAATSSGTVTGGTNYVLTVNSLATGAVSIGQYVAAAGFSTPASYEIMDTNGTLFYLSPSAAVPTLTSVAMTAGPILSPLGYGWQVGNSAGYWTFEYNYGDGIEGLFGIAQTTSAFADWNFLSQGVLPAQHGDPIIHDIPQVTGAAVNSVWDILFQDQSFNTVYTNNTSAAGNIYGGFSGIWAEGANTGNMVAFTNGNATTGGQYYISWGSWNFNNNILVANISANNYLKTNNPSSGYLLYILKDGSYAGGYYPVLTGAFNMNNNILDTAGGTGAIGPAYVSVCPAVSAGSTTHVSPVFSGNFDIGAGTAVTTYVKGDACP